jgi:ankyrin repeat protein
MNELNELLVKETSLGNWENVVSLVDKGADIHTNDDLPLYTALERDLYYNQIKLLTTLIELGANIESRDGYALRKAVISRDKELLELLIKYKVDVNSNDVVALLDTLEPFNITIIIIDILAKAGANVRNAPLLELLRHDYFDFVKFLIIKGSNINQIDDHGNTVLSIASGKRKLYISTNALLEYITFLLSAGANVNKSNDQALFSALGRPKIVKLLLESGANATARDNEALFIASRYAVLETVKLLIKHGADVNAMGDNAIKEASAADKSRFGYDKDNFPVVSILLEAGANSRMNNDYPLRAAVYYDNVEIVKQLLFHGKNRFSNEMRIIVLNNMKPESKVERYMKSLSDTYNSLNRKFPADTIMEVQKYLGGRKKQRSSKKSKSSKKRQSLKKRQSSKKRH